MRWKVPLDDTEDEFWTESAFDDSAWQLGPMGLAYDDNPDYDSHTGTDVTAEMQGVNASIYARARFQVPDPSRYQNLSLEMKYDDGFVAFLNGLYAGSANAPGGPDLAWNSEASLDHSDGEATSFVSFPLPREPEPRLLKGENILMLHGLNRLLTSSDFLISARLVGHLADLPAGPAAIYPEGVSELERTQARVNGWVAATGGRPVHVYAVYGRRDHGTELAAWPHRVFAGSVEAMGRVSSLLRDLEPRAGYAVRFYAQRVASGEIAGWSGPASFATANPELRFVESGSPVQVLIPTSEEDTIDWQESDFATDPARWLNGVSPVGFDLDGRFQVVPATDLSLQMSRRYTSALVRFPFVVGRDAEIDGLTLRMKYDDGFVAYLNGIEVVRSNAGANLFWNSSASGEQSAGGADLFEEFDLSVYAGLLRPGPNVLAVHALNWSATDREFLVAPELVADGDGGNLSPLDVWLFEREIYGGEANPSADPDRDGRSQLEEFAAVRLQEFQTLDDDALLLSYERRPGLQYEIQLSDDLANWWPVLPSATIRELLVDGELERVTSRLLTPSAANDKLFVRILSSVSPGELPLPEKTLLDESDVMHALVPGSPVPGWNEREFDHSSWMRGPARAGYENGSGYQDLIGLDLGQAMAGVNTSAYFRVPFTVADPTEFQNLTLRMKYDDGFVAYLNGVRVVAVNEDPNAVGSWQGGAATTHGDLLAVQFVDFDLTGFLAALVPGENVLALHGLNAGLGSSDFLIVPNLLATTATAAAQPQEPPLPDHYARWALLEGLSGSSANLAADPDGDETNNLAEFALGGEPRRFDRAVTSPQVSLSPGGAQVEVTFRRRVGLAGSGVGIEVEHSRDLLTWQPAPGLTEVAVVPFPGGTSELVTVRFPEQEAAGFVRLRVMVR